MKSKKCIVFLWVLAILPLILTAAVYSRLPEQIPMQWGIDGEISRYGGKGEIWMIAGLGPFLALLFQFLPSLDPKKRSYEQFQIYYEAFALVTEAFFAVVTGLILAETRNGFHGTRSLRPGGAFDPFYWVHPRKGENQLFSGHPYPLDAF